MFIECQGVRPRIAPEASLAPSAVISGDVLIGPGAEVRINGVLHLRTTPPSNPG